MYIGLDVETGGLGEYTSLLTVYMGIYDKDFKLVDEMDLKIKPADDEYVVTAQGLDVNKIDLVKHDKEAKTGKEIKTQVFKFLEKHSSKGKEKLIPVGHNVRFDILRITTGYDKIISKKTWDVFCQYRCIDTGAIGQFLIAAGKLPNINAGLDSLMDHFKLPWIYKAHTAKGDVYATVKVLQKLIDLIK